MTSAPDRAGPGISARSQNPGGLAVAAQAPQALAAREPQAPANGAKLAVLALACISSVASRPPIMPRVNRRNHLPPRLLWRFSTLRWASGEKLEESRDALERALCGRRGRSLNPQPPCSSTDCGSGTRRPSVGSRPGWDSTPATGEAGGGDATGPPMASVGGGTRTPDSTRPESVCREVRSFEGAGDRRSVDGQAAATSGG
jgi:hypothetical protein